MNFSVIDLFAGAGGLGLGAEMAGCSVKLSVELDPIACATLKSNISKTAKKTVLQEDVSTLSGDHLREISGISSSDPVLLIGGPPCQPFSKAAYWTDPGSDSRYRRARAKGEYAEKPVAITNAKPDSRRDLVQEYIRLVLEVKPDGFLFENVPSITHPRNKHIMPSIIKTAEDQGYNCVFFKKNALEFGVAQKRERIFILGARNIKPTIPTAIHSIKKNHDQLPKPVSAGEVLGNLHDENHFEPEEEVVGKWAEHLKQIPPGWNYKALTAWAGHPKPSFIAETRFWNFLLKLDPKLPSWTIAASPGPWTGPFHWDNRRLRTVELAALQSFPSGYHFCGGRRDKVRQIGNAVPPLLAKAVIASLVKDILGHKGSCAAA